MKPTSRPSSGRTSGRTSGQTSGQTSGRTSGQISGQTSSQSRPATPRSQGPNGQLSKAASKTSTHAAPALGPIRPVDPNKPTRLHRPVAEQVISALASTFGATEDGRAYHADKVLERLFKLNKKLGGRDRRFIAESTYDIVRWWRLLWASLGRTEPSLETKDLWHVFGAWMVMNGLEVPQFPELQGLSPESINANREAARSNPAVRESVPDWLYEVGVKELGAERWDSCLAALNQQAPVVLRANRLKGTREEVESELRREGIETSPAPNCPDGLILTERKSVFTTEVFKFGLFEVQDGASQQASPFLDPQPGDRVIDGCAGAGGKTLHMAALMKNKGKIIAMDIHLRRLEELRRRCTRAGVDIVESRVIESTKSVKRLEKTADRVFLDVPCTGLGVLRRNPDSKWKIQPEELERLCLLQAEILENYAEMVKVGGRLVYATCSVLPSENGDQVKAFLAKNDGQWKVIRERQFWPGEDGYDGFYACAMERLS